MLFLHGISALEWWRENPMPSGAAQASALALRHADAPTADDVAKLRQIHCKFSWPVELSVGTDVDKRKFPDVVTHSIAKNLYCPTYIEVGNNLFASEPALALLQACQRLDKITATKWAYMLCAEYFEDDYSATGLSSREKLVSKTVLKNYALKNNGVRGVKTFTYAVAHSLPNAASPREIELAMKLTLPHKVGGQGLPEGALNCKISLTERGKIHAWRSFYVADMCWPRKKLVVEFDSNAVHLSPQVKTADEAKRRTLEAQGYKVITVTSMQLDSVKEMDAISAEIARHLGVRNRVRVSDFAACQYELFASFKSKI